MNPVSIIGGGQNSIRHAFDFYPTPAEVTQTLLHQFPDLFQSKHIWEPACGAGDMSKVLLTCNTVCSTDLHNHGYGTTGQDFLTTPAPPGVTAIVTNPPFRLAAQFIERARSFKVPFAMLLKSTYWHSKKRHALFTNTGPLAVCPLTWRPVFSPCRGGSPTLDFLWTVWDQQPVTTCSYIPLKQFSTSALSG
jgi:hypothetical protein